MTQAPPPFFFLNSLPRGVAKRAGQGRQRCRIVDFPLGRAGSNVNLVFVLRTRAISFRLQLQTGIQLQVAIHRHPAK